ncbi:MAG: hypothetical protein H0V46_02520 [Sphingomonas sp.]|nr:hypothetical protein [Sphingomonas sp.]
MNRIASTVAGSVAGSANLSAIKQRLSGAWLRGAGFDSVFIFGLFGVAILSGLTISFYPWLFAPVLIFDLWFLGYHHVISTYTRLCFDRKSFAEHRFKVLILPVAVGAVTMAAFYAFGLWLIVSIYFYWQWFHYTRQSWGISRAYRAKDRSASYEDGWLDQAIFYALPVLGILHRSNQDPGRFIGLELRTFPMPSAVVDLATGAAVVLLCLWTFRRVRAWQEGRLAAVHTAYMLTHFGIFAAGYLWFPDISLGWLVINMWHNAQYILFVWLFNTRRFKNGMEAEARFISYISQPHRLWLYLAVCLALTAILYLGVFQAIDWLFLAGVSTSVVLYQVVNFHHYVVDSRIWKVRHAPVRQALGLQG